MTYDEYIASKKWAKVRERVLKRDKHQCQTCGETERPEVHHRTYERLFHEKLSDLITLCYWCHEAVTSSIRARRYAPRLPNTTDVQRSTPQNLKDYDNVSQKIILQDTRRVTPADAQRATRRPPE